MYARSEIFEIVLPESSPATEWIGERPVQKMSPTHTHGALQLEIGHRLRRWARGRGYVASEWRFRITPQGSYTRPLVPDVAYLSYERARGLTRDERETPPVAPELVVEILSPDDRPGDVATKREQYLSAGVLLVLLVDPESRRIDAYGGDGRIASAVAPASFEDERFPGLSIPFAEIFEDIDPH